MMRTTSAAVLAMVLASLMIPRVSASVNTAGPRPATDHHSEADRQRLREMKEAFARWKENGTATEYEKLLIAEYTQLGSSRSPAQPLDNTGGPDGYGYRFVDNSPSDTATFDWIELRGEPGTVWVNDFASHDDGLSEIPIGFNFPFYGGVYSDVTLCTNGFLQFSTSANDYLNECLPTDELEGPAILLFWDDLHLDRGGISDGMNVVGYKQFGSYTVIQYDSVGRFLLSDPGSYTFEVILFNDGRIKMQYEAYSGNDTSNTIGIQSAASGPSLQYRCGDDLPGLSPERAIWFFGPSGATHDFTCLEVTSPVGGEIAPGATVNVAADFMNLGTATEGSPVKYRFNNGPIQSGMTAPLSIGQIESHVFAQSFTAPTANGRYVVEVWSELATDQTLGNDTCRVNVHVGCSDYAVTAPGVWRGNSCGENSDCDRRDSDDLTFEVTIPFDGNWTFTTCEEDFHFDTYLYLLADCCGDSVIVLNDDNSIECDHALQSTIEGVELEAGTYYLLLEAFWADHCGDYTLTIEQAPPCIPCEAGDVQEVTETPSDTTFYRTDSNGGCNSDPARFGNINFNQTICGRGFFYAGPGSTYRDTDWYNFTVAEAETVTAVVWSDFMTQVFIFSFDTCGAYDILVNEVLDACAGGSYEVYLEPGTYRYFVAPTFDAGDFGIEDDFRYRAVLHHGALGAGDAAAEIPRTTALHANYPNPFNPATTISYSLASTTDLTLAVYDVMGRVVTTLVEGRQAAGDHRVEFDGTGLPSGLYFVRLLAGETNAVRKMVLLK